MTIRSARRVVAAASGLVLIAGFVIDVRSTTAAYLVAWSAWGAIPIGALIVFMTSYLVRRRWTETLHTVFVATTGILPVVALTFIPILLFTSEIYPAIADGSSLPPFKARWFMPWFFLLRTVLYFLIWIALAQWLRRAWRNDEAMVRAASVGSIVDSHRLVRRDRLAGIAGAGISLLDLWSDLSQLPAGQWHRVRHRGRPVVDATDRPEPRL